MLDHPQYTNIIKRLSSRSDDLCIPWGNTIYRFVDPMFTSTKDLFAVKGALYANGRWLLKGHGLATYTSLQPETAMAEALAAGRYYGFPDANSSPLVFVTADVRLKNVIDLRNGSTRQRLKLAQAAICDTDWRRDNLVGKESITQAWGRAFLETKIEAILIPSSASSAGENLIVFPTNLRRGSDLEVINEVKWPRQ